MATAAVEEPENIRQVDKNVLYSYNLKTENNLNEYLLLIIGMEDDHFLPEDLLYITREDRIKRFTDIEEGVAFLQSQTDTNIFVIISGQLGKQNVDKFIETPRIVGIYVYCMNENEHKIWAKGITKIRCVVSAEKELLEKLHHDIRELSGRWPLVQSSIAKAQIPTSDWYHLFLIAICYRSECIEGSYDEMFDECRAYYRDYRSMQSKINEFQLGYTPQDAIRQYTEDGFIYRIVNHALRTKDIEVVRKFSPFIRDLHSQIYNIHQQYYLSKENYIRAVYRGQYLSVEEVNHLRSILKTNKPVITLTTFGSTTLDPAIAFGFIPPASGQIPCLFEILLPDNYHADREHFPEHEQVFAQIASLSANPHEQEVLFSLITHFSIRSVDYDFWESTQQWLPIQLQLIINKEAKSMYGHFTIGKWIRNETDPSVYKEVLDMLQENAEDESRFQGENWENWWNQLQRNGGKGLGGKQPLNLIFYECFAKNLRWSRRAIDLQKNLLKAHPDIQSKSSSFGCLSRDIETWSTHPTIQIAIYEDYLEGLCNVDRKEVVQRLLTIGNSYKKISDLEGASNCYGKALALNVNDEYQMNKDINKQLRELEKSSRKEANGNNTKPRPVKQNFNRAIPEIYANHPDLLLLYKVFKHEDAVKLRVNERLKGIVDFITRRESWYDTAESKIILRLPYEITDDLSVSDYRSHFLPAVATHIRPMYFEIDATNHRSLSLWRYEKYTSEWMLCKELERFLQPFKSKSIFIRTRILPRLRRLVKKLLVLIVMIIVYKCVERSTYNVNVNEIPCLYRTYPAGQHPISTDLRNSDLRTALERMNDENPVADETTALIPDDYRFDTKDPVPDFLESIT